MKLDAWARERRRRGSLQSTAEMLPLLSFWTGHFGITCMRSDGLIHMGQSLRSTSTQAETMGEETCVLLGGLPPSSWCPNFHPWSHPRLFSLELNQRCTSIVGQGALSSLCTTVHDVSECKGGGVAERSSPCGRFCTWSRTPSETHRMRGDACCSY